MPFVVRSDSENEAELIFLSPEEEVEPRHGAKDDQGASPVLRRSNRKRKSVVCGETDMSKGSGSKKKKRASPDQAKSMPRIPRTPQGTDQGGQPTQPAPGQETANVTGSSSGLEALLLGMEGRLGSKIDSTNKKVDQALSLATDTNTALETLERHVISLEEALEDGLQKTESNILIDDGFSLTKVNFENSYGFEVNGVKFRVKHAVRSQNVFRHLVRRAEDIGMVVK